MNLLLKSLSVEFYGSYVARFWNVANEEMVECVFTVGTLDGIQFVTPRPDLLWDCGGNATDTHRIVEAVKALHRCQPPE
jgi:hypothetical protein